MLLIVVIAALALVYICWRYWRLRRAMVQYARVLPADNRLSWRVQSVSTPGLIEELPEMTFRPLERVKNRLLIRQKSRSSLAPYMRLIRWMFRRWRPSPMGFCRVCQSS